MSTALDLASLAAQGELKIPIARGVVSQGGSGTDYTGWSGVSSVFVEAKAEVREQSRGFATLTLTVEGSSNGSDWSTLETFSFGHGGSQSATVSAPPDHLRVSWAVGGHSEWQIIEVTAAPSVIDLTSEGGGSQPLKWAAFDSLVGTEAIDGHISVLGFEPSFIGAGTLTSCIVATVGGDPAILLPEVGCYLVTVNISAPDFAFGDISSATQLDLEVQVFNSEADPFLFLDKAVTGIMKSGVLTAVCNVLESDDPDIGRGFSVPVRVRGTTFTPPVGLAALKVVQLATT